MTTLLSLVKPILSTYCRSSLLIHQPSRQLKSALKIIWVRPEPIPCILPEQSGDLEPLGTIDMTQFPTLYKASEELQRYDISSSQLLLMVEGQVESSIIS